MKAVKLHRLWADSNQTTGVLVVYDANGQPIFIANVKFTLQIIGIN